MSTIDAFEGITFNTQLEQLSYLLDRLAELHEREVAEARRELADLHSKHDVYASHEPQGRSEVLWLSEANAVVPGELQARCEDQVRFDRESCEVTDDLVEIYGIGSVDSSMVSLEGCDENAAVARWAKLVHLLQRPKGRVAAMKTSGFVTLAVWFMANRERLMRETASANEESQLVLRLRKTVAKVIQKQSTGLANGVPTSSLGGRRLRRLPIMHPNSKLRTLWVALCLILILYDLVIVPIDTFFELEDDTSSSNNGFQVMSILSCIFWSLDIVANFSTGTYIAGILVMKPSAIALAYAKSWLIFDICLITTDWLSTLLGGRGAGAPAEVQALRGLRFLRLLRVLRLGRIQDALEQLLNVPHEGVIVGGAMLKILLGLAIIIHVLACVWYGVGRISEDGWARDPIVVSNSILHNYVLSVHWVASQVHGTSRPMAVTTLEHSFADLLLLSGFCWFVFIVANGTLTVMHFSKVDRWKMQAACARFSDSHNISQTLSARIQHYLALGHRRGGISEKVKEDAELLSALPPSVRADAIDEARWPLLEKLHVFALLQNLNARAVSILCQDAISVSVVLEQGFVFQHGDIGKNVFIIQFGELIYHFQGQGARKSHAPRQSSIQARLSACSSGSFDDDWRQMLGKMNMLRSLTLVWGNYVSEAVLWTKWEHAGDLLAVRDSTILVLSPEIFADTVRERQDLLDVVASYAATYVQRLNQADIATDLFDFELDVDTIDETADDFVSDRHLIFLSHYKAEAGTEATLMKESLTKMICDDGKHPAMYMSSPIFLDSANLQDLSLLRRSVRNSDNLVLLLTPGVLTRPWCLVEIVTALDEFVRIVPVEVQRPGISFKYPDETFYHQLTTGKLLSSVDEQLLRSEGVDLNEVERSLRHVFTQIAMPFSPHKSAQIRQAELSDILNRCTGDVPSSAHSLPSLQ